MQTTVFPFSRLEMLCNSDDNFYYFIRGFHRKVHWDQMKVEDVWVEFEIVIVIYDLVVSQLCKFSDLLAGS